MTHLQRAGLHVGAPHVERDPDVELVRHGLALHQAELADVVAVVGGVHEVGVVQLARLHQHVVELGPGRQVSVREGQGTQHPPLPTPPRPAGLRSQAPTLHMYQNH